MGRSIDTTVRGPGGGSGVPGFLILGAPRRGTTSLFRYLGRHDMIDLAPSLLALLDEPVPDSMEGRPFHFLRGGLRGGASAEDASAARVDRAE